MSHAFRCDRCGEFSEGRPYPIRAGSPASFIEKNYELCPACKSSFFKYMACRPVKGRILFTQTEEVTEA